MEFQILALDDKEFNSYFELSDIELDKIGIKRLIVDKQFNFPCRVSLEDAEIGEEVILISYQHHKTNGPYQASGPIFIRKGVKMKSLKKNQIPIMLNHRLLSFRGYDILGNMKFAITDEGSKTNSVLKKMFDNNEIEYIQIHNSSPGCFNCEVRRVK